jgi:hypothetical protein
MLTIAVSVLSGLFLGIPLGGYLALKLLPSVVKRRLSGGDMDLAMGLKLQSERSVAAFVRHLATHYDMHNAEIVLKVADDIYKRSSRLLEETMDDDPAEKEDPC